MAIRFVISSVIRSLANRSWLKSSRMLFKPTSQTLPLSILQETAELVVPVPSFAQPVNQPAWLFGNGFKINSKVGGSPTEGWSKRGQCRQVEIAEVYYTFSSLSTFFHFLFLISLPYSDISRKTSSDVFFVKTTKRKASYGWCTPRVFGQTS